MPSCWWAVSVPTNLSLTWFPPCKREIPDFIDLQSEYGPKGAQIPGIALDEPGKVNSFARQYGMNYPVLVGTNEVAGSLALQCLSFAAPLTLGYRTGIFLPVLAFLDCR